MTKIAQTDLRKAKTVLFRVWQGTPNADMVLEDVCNTIGSQLGWDSDKRRGFIDNCAQRRLDYGEDAA